MWLLGPVVSLGIVTGHEQDNVQSYFDITTHFADCGRTFICHSAAHWSGKQPRSIQYPIESSVYASTCLSQAVPATVCILSTRSDHGCVQNIAIAAATQLQDILFPSFSSLFGKRTLMICPASIRDQIVPYFTVAITFVNLCLNPSKVRLSDGKSGVT